MSERVVRELERALGAERVHHEPAARAPLVAPTSVEGFQEALALARRDRLVVVPLGLGSKLGWLCPPSRVDFFLSTRAFSGVVAYEPGDGTLTARAGSTMAELAARVAAGGHALTPDVPRPEHATLGGVIAAAQSGADRLRYGPVRDHVLGVQVVLGDGTLARSGGRLVKNVTGYDLQRLFTGSHGSLCVILEASLRLFALPEEECQFTAVAEGRADMLRLCALVLDSPLRPISLSSLRLDPPRKPGQWLVVARLGGRREVLDDERATLARLWPTAHCIRGPDACGEAQSLRDNVGWFDGSQLRVEIEPRSFARALELVEDEMLANGGHENDHPHCQPGLALIDIALRPGAHDVQRLASSVSSLRTALAPLGGRVRWLRAPADATIERFEQPVAGASLMKRIREQLDPDGVFASGRFLEAR